MLLLGNLATAVCCAEVFQPRFAEWSTKRTTEPDTAQTERVLKRLVDAASLDSRLRQSSKRVFHNIHVLSLFHPVLSLPVLHTHNSSWFLGSHLAHGNSAVGYSELIHGNTS